MHLPIMAHVCDPEKRNCFEKKFLKRWFGGNKNKAHSGGVKKHTAETKEDESHITCSTCGRNPFPGTRHADPLAGGPRPGRGAPTQRPRPPPPLPSHRRSGHAGARAYCN